MSDDLVKTEAGIEPATDFAEAAERAIGDASQAKLAPVSQVAGKRQYFTEGTHLAVLHQITSTKSRRGQFVVFELTVVESATMAIGASVNYIMPAESDLDHGLIGSQLRGLGFKPLQSILNKTLDMKVVVTAKLTVNKRGNEFMVIQLWRA